jgi:hypothetical protein
MSTAFTAALPLLEELKENLNKLKSATDEINKAGQSAEEHKQAATQQRNAADAAVRAAQQAAASQEQLLDRLGEQHQKSLSEQELLLHEHAQNLSQQTTEQIGRQLDGVKQSGVKVQELIDRLLDEQPVRLAAIEKQHQQGISQQQELLRGSVQSWADKLHEQMQVELKLLRQATEVLQKNTRQQHDELSAVASQLQVVAGRVTAFAEVMNAAKFTSRLETIEHLGTSNATAMGKLSELYRQQEAVLMAEIQKAQQKSADATEHQRTIINQELTRMQAAHEQQTISLQTSLEQVTTQLVQVSSQQRLWQIVTIVVVVAVGIALFLHRG